MSTYFYSLEFCIWIGAVDVIPTVAPGNLLTALADEENQ